MNTHAETDRTRTEKEKEGKCGKTQKALSVSLSLTHSLTHTRTHAHTWTCKSATGRVEGFWLF